MNPHAQKETFLESEKVRKIQAEMLAEEVFLDLADTFKAISDLTRTKMLYVLSKAEMCVGDLATLLGLSPSAISHQLRLLRHLKLVRHRREGKTTFYALDDQHIGNLLMEGIKHVTGVGDE
jgi:DNA-binding transcriptional ArsR family regulator